MSKLFISCCSLSSGGAERVLSILSKPFADHYDDVQYIMWYDNPVFYDIDKRVKIVCLEKEAGSRSTLKRMAWFRKYVNVQKPDLVLALSAPFNMLTLASLLGTSHKIVAAERVDPRSFRWGKHLEILRNLLYHKATGILAQTEYCKDYFKGSLYKKTDVIFNPVIMPEEMIGSAIRTEKKKVIATAARLAPQKKQDMIIRVFAKFHESHPDYSLKIFGEGAERENLTKLASDLGIANYVELPGSVKDLWVRLQSTNMFVMTSLFEGMSNSMIEAMCLGVPCISTKVSGAVDLIDSGKNGVLIELNDENALYDAMMRIADDSDYASSVANEGAKLYDVLNVDTISQQWVSYIDNIISK